MTVETPPEMTRAEFDAAAAYAYERHWLTGEEYFVRVPAVMEVEGWNRHGHIGHNRLTEPQRKWAAYPETDDWPAKREQVIAHLARKHTRWRPWARRRKAAGFAQFSDTILNTFYHRAVEGGEIVPDDQPAPEVEPIPTEAAEAFDDWFYRDATKAASRTFVGDYIRRHQDELCRLSD